MITYGFLLEQVNNYGSEYVKARIVARQDNNDYPGNATRTFSPDERHFDGLSLIGHVYDNRIIGFWPEYRDVFSVDLSRARIMEKTLAKIEKALAKESVYDCDAPLIYSVVAKTLKLSFAVEQKSGHSTTYCENRWHFMTIPEGRNRLYHLANQAISKANSVPA